MSRPNCVGCSTNGRRGKLLCCLHTLCVSCLEQHVGHDGSAVCPECTRPTGLRAFGRSQLTSLPDSYPPASQAASCGGGGAAAVYVPPPALCDECGKDELAVATCADCGNSFCEIHARAHPLSRSFLGHRVAELRQPSSCSERPELSGQSCPLHPTLRLVAYCQQCDELLCEQCRGKSQHRDHLPRLLPVEQAAAKLRRGIRDTLRESEASGNAAAVLEAVHGVQDAMAHVHDRTEEVSEKVTDCFEQLALALSNRRDALLDELDRLRAAKLEPLEREKRYLNACLRRGETVASQLETCADDTNFLKMAPWLQDAAWQGASALQSHGQEWRHASAECNFVFEPGVVGRGGDDASLAELIAAAGTVADCAVDARRSTLAFAEHVHVRNDVAVRVLCVDRGGRTVTAEQAAAARLTVEIRSPNGKAIMLRPTARVEHGRGRGRSSDADDADSGGLAVTFRPTLAGHHYVSALAAGRHLHGSPAVMVAAEVYAFHPEHRHAAVALSPDGRTCRLNEELGHYAAACGARLPPLANELEIRLRLDAMPSANLFLCLCTARRPTLDNFHQQASELHGWYALCTDASRRWCSGSPLLGQQWLAGDVVSLTYNRTRRTLVGVHERSRQTETLHDVGDGGERVCLYVAMRHRGQQVTIVSVH